MPSKEKTVKQSEYYAGQSDSRPWGRWQVVEANPSYTLKRIEVDPGQRLSLQYHNYRSEHWVVVSGSGVATIGGDAVRVERGSHIYVPRETKHRIANDGEQELVFIEVQFGDRLEEEDIVRIEDDYERES